MGKIVVFFLVAFAVFFAGWSLRTPSTPLPPKIITVYDTVKQVDTLWKIKLVKETKWDTVFTEKVVITAVPETVLVNAIPKLVLNGVTTLQVGKEIGDTTKILGQTITMDTGGVYRRPWEVNYYTPGPLTALSTDTFPPRVKFGKPPNDCAFKCRVKIFGTGAGVTAVVITILRAVLH